MEMLEWCGCITGLMGAALLAAHNRYSGWGFVLFLISNVAWIGFGLLTHATGMVVMQLGFTLTSALGVWNWLVVDRGGSDKTTNNGRIANERAN